MIISSHTEPKTGGINEDALECVAHPENGWIVALADGQGGRAGGAEASQTAVNFAIRIARAVPLKTLCSGRFWTQLLFDVDKAVHDEPEAGFTTFIGAVISPGHGVVVGVSSGDSRAILFHEKGTVVLTANQKKNPPVGSKVCHPAPFSERISEGSRIMFMSDGVYKYVAAEEISEAVGNLEPEDAIKSLRDKAAGKSGTLYDDFSAVIVEVES